MLAVTTRSFAPSTRRVVLPWADTRKNSPPIASPAAAAPTRVAKSPRVRPPWSFELLGTLPSYRPARDRTPFSALANVWLPPFDFRLKAEATQKPDSWLPALGGRPRRGRIKKGPCLR